MIRPMRPDDLDAVLALDVASFVPERAMTAAEARQVREQQLREELVRAWARLRVATVHDRVVGYLLSWHVVDEVHLLNVAVAVEHRRQGLGEALVRSLVEEAVADASAKILLEVRASNVPAITLYERLGFERFHVRPRYYADGEDGVEMMLTFPLG